MVEEVRVFTVPLDRRTGCFDDSAMRSWLTDRELVRVESQYFVWRETPTFGLVVTKASILGRSYGPDEEEGQSGRA